MGKAKGGKGIGAAVSSALFALVATVGLVLVIVAIEALQSAPLHLGH
jgi:hypothetical protein